MTSSATASAQPGLRRQAGGPEGRLRTARHLAVASGALVLVCTGALIADYTVGVWRTARQDARIVELEGQTGGDAEVAAVLHEERKRQTNESLARERRGRALAWALLLSGGAFVAAGKWWVSLRPQRVPALEDLVAVRLGDAAGETSSPGRHLGRDNGGKGNEDARGSGRGEGAGVDEREQDAGAQGVEDAGARGEGREDARGNGRTEGAGAEEIGAAGARGGGGGNVAPETVPLEFVDGLIDRFGRDRESAIPILQSIQAHYRYLPDEVLRAVCERTEITPAQIAGTSSFYSQFRRSPVGRHVVKVCHGTACHVAGAEQITEELRRHLEIPAEADTDSQRLFTIDKVACLGCCSLAPVMMIEEDTAGRLTPATARKALDAVAKRS